MLSTVEPTTAELTEAPTEEPTQAPTEAPTEPVIPTEPTTPETLNCGYDTYDPDTHECCETPHHDLGMFYSTISNTSIVVENSLNEKGYRNEYCPRMELCGDIGYNSRTELCCFSGTNQSQGCGAKFALRIRTDPA